MDNIDKINEQINEVINALEDRHLKLTL